MVLKIFLSKTFKIFWRNLIVPENNIRGHEKYGKNGVEVPPRSHFRSPPKVKTPVFVVQLYRPVSFKNITDVSL
jgi:hypothetical protein